MNASTLSVPRFRLALAAIFCGALALFMILLAGTAHADPVVVAQATTDAGWTLIEQHGPLWGGTLLAFGMLSAFLRRNDSSHWIARGRVLSALTGAAMVLEAVLAWHLNGAPSAGIAVALFAALSLVMHSTVAGPSPASVTTATGRAAAGSVLLVLCVLLMAGCTKQQVATGVRSGSSCQTPSIIAAVGELLGWASERLAVAIEGGKVDGAKLRGAMANVVDTSPRCAIEAVIAGMAETSARSSLAGPSVNGAALRSEFEQAKRELGWAVQ